MDCAAGDGSASATLNPKEIAPREPSMDEDVISRRKPARVKTSKHSLMSGDKGSRAVKRDDTPRYKSFADLEALIKGKEGNFTTGSHFARAIIEDCRPGLSYAIQTKIAKKCISPGRADDGNLESWLGPIHALDKRPVNFSKDEIVFLEKSFDNMKKRGMNKGCQVCWLANYAAHQNLGKLFQSPAGQKYRLYAKNIKWYQLPPFARGSE
jgi:hypothetical protein